MTNTKSQKASGTQQKPKAQKATDIKGISRYYSAPAQPQPVPKSREASSALAKAKQTTQITQITRSQTTTSRVQQRLSEQDYDPIDDAIIAARDGVIGEAHPAQKHILNTLNKWIKIQIDGGEVQISEIESLSMYVRKELAISHLPPALRIKCVLDLLQYAYPKQKSTTETKTDQATDAGVTGEMTTEQSNDFIKRFTDNF